MIVWYLPRDGGHDCASVRQIKIATWERFYRDLEPYDVTDCVWFVPGTVDPND